MKIDFSYRKKHIVSNSGYIFKGRHYRCGYIYDRNVAKRLIIKEMIEDPLDDF